MIDIHAHILPGIDDGSRNLESSLEMAAMAVESGVKIMAATPHCCTLSRTPNLWGPELDDRVQHLRRALKKAQIPLQIVPGMEIFGTEDVPELLRSGRMIGLNGSRYPLIEFPFSDYAGRATDILQEVVKLGMRPVVAHPERYYFTQEDPTVLNLWVQMGCLLQVNKGSLQGRFGPGPQRFSWELVGRQFAYIVASDTHSPRVRTPWMVEAAELLRENFGRAAPRKLLQEHPARVLNDEEIRPTEPEWFR